jgi:glycosyltransferase involved in cell wall biosynthesis
MNYVSFLPPAVWRAVRLGRFDGIVATSPQFFCAVAGGMVGALKGTPWVFELRDLWPDSIVAVGAVQPSAAVRLVEKLELALYRHAHAIVCVSPAFIENLASRGIEREKLEFVPNGIDVSFWSQPGDGAGWRSRHGLAPEHLVVSFVGTVGMAHGLGTLLEAAARLKEARPEVRVVIVGDGAEREGLERRAREGGLSNVLFTGLVPRQNVRDVMEGTDIALVLLRDSPVFRTVLPTKMFEAMAARRPIVLGVDGQARRVLEASGGGVYVPPGDGAALAGAVSSVADEPDHGRQRGEAGHAFVIGEYDRVVWARRYAELLGRWFGQERSQAFKPAR